MFKVNRTKDGRPTLTENGGGASNTGSCTLIAGPQGEPLAPLGKTGGYSQGDHATFVVAPGDLIVQAGHSRRDETVTIFAIVEIDDNDEVAAQKLGSYENGDSDLAPLFDELVVAALGKSHCYHCREAHYAAVPR